MTINELIIICITGFILLISSYIIKKCFGNKPIKIQKFQQLLESPKNYSFNPNYLNDIKNCDLIETMDKFCQTNNVYKNGIVVSLSGGVDSMVCFAILIHLRKTNNFPIYTATIDYALREESVMESEFIQKYTSMFGINSYVVRIGGISRKKEDSGSRTEFEEESRHIRFNTYKHIMEKHSMAKDTGVLVAHHMDDIVENIFTNMMRGANILDLEVMKNVNTIHGVKLFRPFLGFKKQAIYDFAHKYGVPYFLDTTPTWSKRGKMRNEIFPLLDCVFGNVWHDHLKYLGEQSNVWGEYIDNYIVKPWYGEIKFGDNDIVIPIKEQPKQIYSIVIMKALHSIGYNMIKRTSLDKIMDLIHNKKNGSVITLDGGRMATRDDNNLVIIINKVF
jgi:tRNA(Ile)-lysidine synthetase-like protein